MARRFILQDEDIIKKSNDSFEFVGREVNHIHSLRLNIGDKITINENICIIKNMTRQTVEVSILKIAPKFGVPNVNVTLYMGILKGDKMDFVIKKATELGVKKIVPFFSKNVVVKLDKKDIIKKKDKYQIIANEACKQCGRTDSVEILDFLDIDEIINEVKNYDRVILAYENDTNSLKSELTDIKKHDFNNIAVVVGAEGGFDKSEVLELRKCENIRSVSISNRILRAETAVMLLLSIIMYELDN